MAHRAGEDLNAPASAMADSARAFFVLSLVATEPPHRDDIGCAFRDVCGQFPMPGLHGLHLQGL